MNICVYISQDQLLDQQKVEFHSVSSAIRESKVGHISATRVELVRYKPIARGVHAPSWVKPNIAQHIYTQLGSIEQQRCNIVACRLQMR